MAEKTYVEIATLDREVAEASLEAVKTALTKNDMDAYNKGKTELEKKVKALNISICNVAYEEFTHEPNPMIAAVRAFHIKTVKITEVRNDETGAITDIRLDSRDSRIDLERFCDFCIANKIEGINKDWANKSSKLLALLVLRVTNVFALKPSELASKSYYFISAANRKKDGETPDSNTQIVRLLQEIIDDAIFVDNGKGQNEYKCTNHDIAFIQSALTKLATKEKCTIQTINERQFKTVIMSVFAHCLGEAYKVKAAKIKNS